ncbi:hypothetical protein QP786_00175 [Gleimia europaea]|nr:hypothetical protein [Gleimia europaea]MDK8534431.1 hypothetical protein [Gleimia europaea]
MKIFKWIKPPKDIIELLWEQVHEPKSVTILMAIAYVLALAVGLITIKNWADTAEFTHAALLIMGGVLGAFSSLIGYYKLERPAIVLCCGGVVTWIVSAGLTRFSLLALVVLLFLFTRWQRIRVFDVTPGEPVIEVKGLTR